MIRSILVPLDGSSFGEHALPLATSLARRAGATVHLVHVHQSEPMTIVDGIALVDSLDLHLRQDEQAYLADVARRVTESAPLPLTTALLDGDMVPVLRAYAEENGIDLVVMSTHGRGALGRFWLGGVAEDFMRKMTRPVLLVRPQEGKTDLRLQPALKSILLPLDGSALAEQVIDQAMTLGQPFDARFRLVRVTKPMLRPTYLPEGGGILGLETYLEQLDALQQKTIKEFQTYLDGIAAKLTARGFATTTSVVIDDEPAAGILREAASCDADLIAMETHGRRGLPRLILGSVADKIVRAGTLPVLLGRPAK
jgi:nucleotide-binding universal stress UspA family protein